MFYTNKIGKHFSHQDILRNTEKDLIGCFRKKVLYSLIGLITMYSDKLEGLIKNKYFRSTNLRLNQSNPLKIRNYE